MAWFNEKGLSCPQVSDLIDAWIFNERDRKILHRRFIDGIHLEDLAAEFDISVSQVKRIVYRGQRTIQSQCW
jgi:DNA-directed RNA polymerase specialized sigma subunit